MKFKDTSHSFKVWLFFLVTIFSGAIGQYVGGAVLLNLVRQPLTSLHFDTLLKTYWHYRMLSPLPNAVFTGLAFASGFVFAPALIFTCYFVSTLNKEEIHGSARFANDRELAKSGLFPNQAGEHPSILLGKMSKGRFKDRFVELVGQTFIALSAPTGSGKGVGFVLPNLVNFRDSVVVVDVKLENFIKTAGYRKSQGQQVYLFAPDGYSATAEDSHADILRSHRWNPLHYVRRSDARRVGDILTITASLYPLTGKDDIWNVNAGKLFTGLTLWMLDTENETGIKPSIPYMLNLVGVQGGLKKWMKEELENNPSISLECRNEFNAFLAYPDDTSGSVLANFNTPLAIFSDKTVADATVENDFDFDDLRRGGISLYVGIQPPNLEKFSLLLNLFFEQLISVNTRVLPENDPSLTHQCLLMLDEFPALGKINQISKSIGYTRQFNLRYALIYQDYSQLEEKYGKEGAKNIIKNCSAEIIYPPKDVDARVEAISKTLGTKTVKVRNHSENKGGKTSKGNSWSYQKRPLMMPHEICELGHKMHPKAPIGVDVLLLKENQRAFIMQKNIYFDQPEFVERIEHSKANTPEIPKLEHSTTS
ncbi:type IV secretory system conjugative DNA transfer family protein [Vibrio harveyi]|uniref:type IV secretory system conjugative DNA transfer family protein n=1 Tax=Vibrio harveyi TaxID=669 RepID=UPI003CFAF937